MKNERRVAVGVWPLVGAARISLRTHPGNTTPRREPWKVRNLTHLNRLRWGLRSVPGEQSLPPMTTFQVLHQDRMEANSKDTPPPHTHLPDAGSVLSSVTQAGLCRLKATTPDSGLSLTTVCSLSPVTPRPGGHSHFPLPLPLPVALFPSRFCGGSSSYRKLGPCLCLRAPL